MAGRLVHIFFAAAWLSVTASAARAEQDPQVESAARRLLAEGGYRTAFDAGTPQPELPRPPRSVSFSGGDVESGPGTGVWVVVVAAVLVAATVVFALVFERRRRRSSGASKPAAVRAAPPTAAAVPAPKDVVADDDPDALEAAGLAEEAIRARLRRAFAIAFAGRPPAPALTARAAFARLPGAFAAQDAVRDLVRLVEHARYAGFPVEAGHLAESRAALARVVAVAGARS